MSVRRTSDRFPRYQSAPITVNERRISGNWCSVASLHNEPIRLTLTNDCKSGALELPRSHIVGIDALRIVVEQPTLDPYIRSGDIDVRQHML